MKKYRSESDCLNCGTQVEAKFCPNCGQENLEIREPFWSFLFHNIGHYFHFDSKFLKSFVPLVIKPGQLTKEFIAGKRASHFPPFTLYLFVSLVFFLLVLQNQEPAFKVSNQNKIIKAEKIDSLKKALNAKNLNTTEKKLINQQIVRFTTDSIRPGQVTILGDVVSFKI